MTLAFYLDVKHHKNKQIETKRLKARNTIIFRQERSNKQCSGTSSIKVIGIAELTDETEDSLSSITAILYYLGGDN